MASRSEIEGPHQRRSSSGLRTLLLGAAGLLLAVVAIRGALDAGRSPRSLVQWVDAASAQAQASASGKPILFDFSADWCQPCKEMEREVFADRDAADFINRTFVPVRLMEGERQADVLRERHGVSSFPTLMVLTGHRERQRSEGYSSLTETRAFLAGAAAAQ